MQAWEANFGLSSQLRAPGVRFGGFLVDGKKRTIEDVGFLKKQFEVQRITEHFLGFYLGILAF